MGYHIRPTWPATYGELVSWHGLAVTVEDGVVRLWLVDAKHRTTAFLNDSSKLECSFAEVLLFEYKTGHGSSQRSQLSTSLSREFQTHFNFVDVKRKRGIFVQTEDDGYRYLARTCRLVCRDWAKQIPLGDPSLGVTNGRHWHCVADVWRVPPKRHWAWEFRGIEWWMERSHRDSTGWINRDNCKEWYPKLIQPIDDSLLSNTKKRWMIPLVVTSEQYRTDLEPCIGLHFLDNVRDMDSRGLYRTCRLVCRDWARRYPFGDPERGRLRVSEGVMSYWIEGDWHLLPSTYWEWTFRPVEWWAERCCQDLSCCAKMGCKGRGWYPKLIGPIDDTIRQNPEYWMSTVQSFKCKPLTLATASSLPPDLFKHICSAADSESRSWRLVCRYWNEQCTPRVFERIDIDQTPELIRALWKVREHPTFKLHVKIIDGVPSYEYEDLPWIHLLTQICTSTQAVWRPRDGRDAQIVFGNIDQKIRSIHYGLPRSVPRSFSCGIRSIRLLGMKVRQIEDLTHLACELPDLERLECHDFTFDAFPAELPLRRPRNSRNKLKEAHLTGKSGAESTPLPLVIPTLGLFLGVYDAASFFSDEEVTVFLATLSLAPPYLLDQLVGIYDQQTRQLDFRLLDSGPDLQAYFRFKVSSAPNTTALQVGIDTGRLHGDFGGYLDDWKTLDTMFGRLPESLEVCTQVVFGFRTREDMVYFAENALERLPSISEHFTVQYSIGSRNEEKGGWHWYQASLDSEELRGEPKDNLLHVYP